MAAAAAAAAAAAEVTIGGLVALNSLLTAVLVLRRRRLRQLIMYQLVASMSLGETLTGAVSVLLGSLTLLQVPVSSWACVIGIHFRYSMAASTAVGFFCISMERYITVVHGLRYYDILTDGRRRLLLAASWAFAAVFFCTGIALQRSQAPNIDLRGEKCTHSKAITTEFKLFGAMFTLATYLANSGINILVGIVSIRQARKIRSMEASIGGSHQRTRLQQRGLFAIAVLSLMYCVFVFPNAVRIIAQSLGLKVHHRVSEITGFLRLFGMMTDGWCLTLLCPMLREECAKMFCRPSKRRQSAEQTPGSYPLRSMNVKTIFGNDYPTALTTRNAKRNDNIETLDGKSLSTFGARRHSASCSGECAEQTSARDPPGDTRGAREVPVLPPDRHQGRGGSAAGGGAASPSTSSAPAAARSASARPATTLWWSRHHYSHSADTARGRRDELGPRAAVVQNKH